MLPLLLLVLGIGALLGFFNGILVAKLRLPSIIVTLATLVGWRDALLWFTQGAWIQGLPASFQWFGFSQKTGTVALVSISLFILLVFTWGLRSLGAGRAIYAVGSDSEAARLSGIAPAGVVLSVFVMMGVLTGLAALMNAVRFSAVPSNVGVGLELKAIAAVVVGGTAITGGRGNLFGTLIGTALLGTIGTALTFLGINPFWEKAIQGAIILAALASDVALESLKHGRFGSARVVAQN
jgi:rhamnose transport system permease protein